MSYDAGRLNLPAISGASQNSRASSPARPASRADGAPPIPEVASKFNSTFQQLASIPFPNINHETSVKGRLATLETSAEAQHEFNNMSCRTIAELNNSLHGAEDMIKAILRQSNEAFDAKLALFRKEYDHRFELQSSENKRLQNHIATLKSDNHVLKHKLQSTIEKLRKLQHEFGDPDGDFEEESSVLLSTTSVSRPATSIN